MPVYYNRSSWTAQSISIENQSAVITNNDASLLLKVPVSSLERQSALLLPIATEITSLSLSAVIIDEQGDASWLTENENATLLPTTASDSDYMYDIDGWELQNTTAQTLYLMVVVTGVDPQTYKTNLDLMLSSMYFKESELYTWVSKQQVTQFVNMYPDVVNTAYKCALGDVQAQFGNYYKFEELLEQTDETQKDNSIRWVLCVLTAYSLCGSSLQLSEPLKDNYDKAHAFLDSLKTGQSSLLNDREKVQTDGTYGTIVSQKSKYIG